MFSTTNKFLPVLAASMLALVAAQPAAATETKSEVGILTCTTVEGTGSNYLIHSTVDVKCQFVAGNGKTEFYKGETGIGLGIALNIKVQSTLKYTVFSSQTGDNALNHGLAGKYGGAKMAATVGVGIGAAALVGGSGDSFTLNPIAIEASTGIFGAEGGAAYLHIVPDMN